MIADASKQTPWWEAYVSVLDPAYQALIQAEQTADEILHFNSLAIPALLQTENYSRAATRNSHLLPITKDDFELHAELRVKRQWYIHERANPPRIEIVLDEVALQRQLGGLEVLREQLLHMVKLAKLPYVSVCILPLTRPLDYYGDYGSCNFTLIKFDDGVERRGLYREQGGGYQLFTEYMPQVQSYRMLFKHLRYDAWSPEQSLAAIESLTHKLGQSV